MRKKMRVGSFLKRIDAMKEYATAEKRLGEPEDIAAIVSLLASDDAKWINGSR
jgi:3-oxoacyl-[acyl-carrier protein] reductase